MFSRLKEKRKAAKADYQDASNQFNWGENYSKALKSANRAIKGYRAINMVPISAAVLKLRINNAIAHEKMAKNRQKYIASKLKEEYFHL